MTQTRSVFSARTRQAILLCGVSFCALIQGAKADEIIVTANKREQLLQDVAGAVTVIDQTTLQSPSVTNVADLSDRVPGLSVLKFTRNNNRISLRGLSPTDFRAASSALTGVYVDDMPISDSSIPDLAFYDLARVEVLRGPQGTLYGESSMGGTIKYVTNAPVLGEFSGALDGAISMNKDGGENYEVNGLVNIPLAGDIAALRIVGSYLDDGGFVDNAALDIENADAFDRVNGRASLLVEPNDRMSARLTGFYQRFEAGDKPNIFNEPTNPFAPPLLDEFGDDIIYKQFEGRDEDEIYAINFTLDAEIGAGILTSATSYYERDAEGLDDETQTTRILEDILVSLAGAPIFLTQGTETASSRQFKVLAQEIRYTGSWADRLSYTIGGYYRKRETSERFDVQSPEFGAIVSAVIPGYDGFLQAADQFVEFEQFALFSQATLSVTDVFRITGGLRYFDESVNGTTTLTQLDTSTFTPFDVTPDIPDLGESDVLFRAGLEYDLSDSTLLYTNFAQGFRPGGINARFNPFESEELSPRTFNSDNADSFDVGLKTSTADNRVIFNLAGYYIDYTNVQVRDSRMPGFDVVRNAAAAESYGIEVETILRPTDSLLIGGSFAWVNSEFSEDTLDDGFGNFEIEKGREFPGTRDVSFNIYGEYRRPVGWNSVEFVANANVSHASDALSTLAVPGDRSFRILDDYTIANLAAGLEEDDWSVIIFANNVTNEVAELGGFDRSGILRNKPRVIGVKAGFRF